MKNIVVLGVIKIGRKPKVLRDNPLIKKIIYIPCTRYETNSKTTYLKIKGGRTIRKKIGENALAVER